MSTFSCSLQHSSTEIKIIQIKLELFRTHAHQWGTVITGYKYDTRTDELIEFAKGNPQWPQAFYPVTANVTLTPGDFFVARCTYNTDNNPSNTYIGTVISIVLTLPS